MTCLLGKEEPAPDGSLATSLAANLRLGFSYLAHSSESGNSCERLTLRLWPVR